MLSDTGGEMKGKICITAVLAIVLICGIPTTFGQQCTPGAEFIITYDNVIPFSNLNITDANLTFFRDVLRFSDQEIQTATQSAFEFFNTTYGLDFSGSEPNQQGQRIFQNASLRGGQYRFTATAKSSRWLVNGNTNSRCFDVRLGWLGVGFLGRQVLRGTYGGSDGRVVFGPLDDLNWMYVWIDTCPQSPVIILLRTSAPRSSTPDRILVEPATAYHQVLGNGVAMSTLLFQPLPQDQSRVRVVIHISIVFPGNAIP